jgi:hypothetical protein
MRPTRALVCCLIATQLLGCALFREPPKKVASPFTEGWDCLTVVFYRNSFMGSAVPLKINLGDREVGILNNDGYAVVYLPAGAHELKLVGLNNPVPLKIEEWQEGRAFFYRVEMPAGTPEEIKQEAAETELLADCTKAWTVDWRKGPPAREKPQTTSP